jgi:hypothetical protein
MPENENKFTDKNESILEDQVVMILIALPI